MFPLLEETVEYFTFFRAAGITLLRYDGDEDEDLSVVLLLQHFKIKPRGFGII